MTSQVRKEKQKKMYEQEKIRLTDSINHLKKQLYTCECHLKMLEEAEKKREEEIKREESEEESEEEKLKMSQQVVVAEYYGPEVVYKVPKGIDLNDKSVVENWFVRRHTLYIKYVGKDKEEKLEPVFDTEQDFKFPNKEEVMKREDYELADFIDWSDDEDEEEEEEDEEEEEEEEEEYDQFCWDIVVEDPWDKSLNLHDKVFYKLEDAEEYCKSWELDKSIIRKFKKSEDGEFNLDYGVDEEK